MGKFEAYKSYDDMIKRENCIAEGPNHFVDSGKVFMIDFAFAGNSWINGNWATTRYMRVGTSANTNAGISGPASGVDVSESGAWQGVASSDFKLTSDITATPATITTLRSGKTVHLYATITDSNVTDGTVSGYNILEQCIMFGTGVAGNDPVQYPIAANRENAMIIRGVNYYAEDDLYKAKIVRKDPGEQVFIRYMFSDFEG